MLAAKVKLLMVYLFSIIALVILTLCTRIAVTICRNWHGIVIGIGLMLIAILLHILARKQPLFYILSFTVNFISSGFSVAAYYTTKKIPLDLADMFLAVLPAALILTLVCIVLWVSPNAKKAVLIVSTASNIVLLGVAVCLWIGTGSVLSSFAFFCLLVSLFYICIFSININHDERSVLRDISYGSFGSFLVLTLVVIIILSEGDIIGDLGDFSGSGKKKGNK